MFDAAVVCLVRLSSFPVASCEALRELKELISPRAAVGAGEVVQAQHQSLSKPGGSDAKPSEATPHKPTAAVPPPGYNAAVGEFAGGGSAPHSGAARATVSGSRTKRDAGGAR